MRRLLACCLLLLITTLTQAAERPRIGLVLSGGGARGIAHIGVLKVLEELRVPIDAIGGTSMGAVIGGAYAAGVPVSEMERLIGELDWGDLFRDSPPRQLLSTRRKQDEHTGLAAVVGLRGTEILLPEGAVSGQKLNLFLRDLVGRAATIENFDWLPIPFRAIATDLTTGEMRVFDSGSLVTVLRASMSIPGIISPLELDGRLYVDGGLVRNLPVDIVREMGVDVVIAVNLGTPLMERRQLRSALSVTVQMIAILTEQNVQQSLASLNETDVAVLPRLGDISATDFPRGPEAITLGAEAAQVERYRLSRLSVTPREYAAWRNRFRSVRGMEPRQRVVIDEIRFEQTANTNPQVLRELLRTRPGEVLDQETLRRDLERLHGRGDFDLIGYRVVPEGDRNVLVLDAYEKTWGPSYLRFGLSMNSDFQGNSELSLPIGYLQTWVNPLGAEWRVDATLGTTQALATEFYQPLSTTGRLFLAPYASYADRPENRFQGDRQLAEFRVRTGLIGVDLGLHRTSASELRFGPAYRHTDTRLDVGAGDPSETSVSQLGLRMRYFRDTLDDPDYPTSGDSVRTELWWLRDLDRSDDSYGRLELDWLRAYGTPDHRGQLGLRIGARLDRDLPFFDQFTLGGFQNLSGFQTDQLRGQYLGLGRLLYQYRIGRIAGTWGGSTFVGASLEAGNVWQDSDAIGLDNLRVAGGVFLGIGSFLGPVQLGFGYAEGSNISVYFRLGRSW